MKRCFLLMSECVLTIALLFGSLLTPAKAFGGCAEYCENATCSLEWCIGLCGSCEAGNMEACWNLGGCYD